METNYKSKLLLPIVLLSSLFMATSSMAHHSLVGEFDTSKSFEIRGSIYKVEWTNPHIWIYLDVVADNGKTEKWECEMGSPNQLIRQGWAKEDMPLGTIIRAQANPARAGERICSTRRLTLDDGTPVFSRSGDQ